MRGIGQTEILRLLLCRYQLEVGAGVPVANGYPDISGAPTRGYQRLISSLSIGNPGTHYRGGYQDTLGDIKPVTLTKWGEEKTEQSTTG